MEATATCSLSAAPKALAAHLTAVKPAIAGRSCVSALTGVRIVTEGGDGTFMYATDMEVSVRRALTDVTVIGEMDVLVTHADLARAVKLFAKRERVELRVEEDDLSVTDGTRTINLRKLRLEDYPPFPALDEDPLLTADGEELAGVIMRAARFASSDETRPVLTGVAFVYAQPHPYPAGPRVWATDSYRLCDLALDATVQRGAPSNGDLPIVNVPARGAAMAAKAMRKAGAVRVTTSRNTAFFRFAGETWAVRIIDGQYPNFRQLVPEQADVELTVPVDELLGACEVAVAFARRNAPMRLSVNGEVTVSGYTPDVADFREVLPSASYTVPGEVGGLTAPLEDALEVGLNPDFVRDIAAALTTDTATLRLISSLRPVLFVEGDDLYLQMPIRLNV